MIEAPSEGQQINGVCYICGTGATNMWLDKTCYLVFCDRCKPFMDSAASLMDHAVKHYGYRHPRSLKECQKLHDKDNKE